jgi:hypothetical protein
MLFDKWLEDTRKLQIEAFGTDPASKEGKELLAYLFVQTFATLDEMHEAAGEFSWKTWSSKEFFNRREYVKELVDALHFIANGLVAAKVTDEELNEIYEAKMQVNRDRQAAGYSNENKCGICKRALDDVKPSIFDSKVCEICVPDVS